MNPIVGIGEVLWDGYPDGRKVAGGAPFNFAFHCHQLGHPAVIVSRVGDDDLGHDLRDRVRELGLSDEFIQTDREHPTGTVQVTLDANKVPTYTITPNVAWDHLSPVDSLGELGTRASAICFGTLAQRCPATECAILYLLHESRTARPDAVRLCDLNLRQHFHTPVLLERSIRRCYWLKVNQDEMIELLQLFPVRDLKEFDLIEAFRYANHLSCLCVTNGALGCVAVTRDETIGEPGVPAKVVDTVGAGDAFTAAMVCLHLEGRPLRECARFANHYAARVCEQPGGTPRIDRREVESAAFGR